MWEITPSGYSVAPTQRSAEGEWAGCRQQGAQWAMVKQLEARSGWIWGSEDRCWYHMYH